MTSDHKKPGVAFWGTIVFVLLVVIYPLSFAATIALEWTGLLPEWGRQAGRIAFYPLIWILSRILGLPHARP